MASSQIHIYYPRGIRRLQYGDMPADPKNDHALTSAEGHQVVYSNGDDEVKELYKQYRATKDTATWAFHNQVLKCAKRLMPHLTSFVYFQAHNARLHDNAFVFLNEVIQFVESGRCSMQPLTAYELIDDHPDRESGAAKSGRVRAPQISNFYKDGIVQWVSHPGGFEHLVETLYVFFGPARVEKEAELPIRSLSERKLTNGWVKISGE